MLAHDKKKSQTTKKSKPTAAGYICRHGAEQQNKADSIKVKIFMF